MSQRPVIGITLGDPASIGPEIILKALAQRHPFHDACRPMVIGDVRVLEMVRHTLPDVGVTVRAVNAPADAAGEPGTVDVLHIENADPTTFTRGEVSGAAGRASAEYIVRATKLAMSAGIAAIVTAPINKESINAGGYHYAGHTELLADLTNATDVSMMLTGGKLRILHVSTHVSLLEAVQRVKKERVLKVIRLANTGTRMLGIEKPRIAVAGLNPHAGESGLFGTEEIDEITPAIEAAQREGIDATGPWPPDTVFWRASNGQFDTVIAMYHDQGHIPMKLLGFDEGVNVSIGLPIIRTSVDHGTAFDIVGKNLARENSLIAAIDVAVQMVQARTEGIAS